MKGKEIKLEDIKPFKIYWTPGVGFIDRPEEFSYGYYTFALTKEKGLQINMHDKYADVVTFEELEPRNYIMNKVEIPNIVYQRIISGIFEEAEVWRYFLWFGNLS